MKPKKRNAVVKLMEFFGVKKAPKLNIFSPEIRNEVVAIHEMLSYMKYEPCILYKPSTESYPMKRQVEILLKLSADYFLKTGIDLRDQCKLVGTSVQLYLGNPVT